jgi:hypothetical protein
MIKFQQESGPDFQQPWQVIVRDDASILYGRPDALYLVGFGPKGVQDVTLFWRDALADPAKAVGLAPTFTGPGSEMFGVDLVVVSCEEWTADETTVAMLHERELEMRRVLP